MKKAYRKGFTLIELMVVVAMISIIAAIAYPSYQKYIIRSNESNTERRMLSYRTEIKKEIANVGGSGYYPNDISNTPGTGLDIVYVGGNGDSANYNYQITLGVLNASGAVVGMSGGQGTVKSWRMLAVPNTSGILKKSNRYFISETERCFEEYPNANLTIESGCSVASAKIWK